MSYLGVRLRLLYLISFILAATPLSAQNSPLFPSGGVSLSLSYLPGEGASPIVLRLELTNKNTQPVTILTGVIIGSAPHPAAAFRFALQLPDRQIELHCIHPSCEPLGIIAGSLSPYTVALARNQAFQVDIPLSDLRTIDGSQEVGTIATTLGSRLIVSFIGQPLFLKGNAVDSGDHSSYWVGAISQTIPLLLKLVPATGKP